MSYVHWSNYSDLYIYSDIHGGFTVEIGTKRRRYGGPNGAIWLGAWLYNRGNWGKVLIWVQYKIYMWSLAAYNWIFPAFRIGLDYDGESMNVSTFTELLDIVVDLNNMGYNVPPGFIDEMKTEIHELCNGVGCDQCELGERPEYETNQAQS